MTDGSVTASKYIITRRGRGIVAALQEGCRITELHVEKDQSFQVGNIYIGKILNIVKNINAAFVDFGCGINGYLALEKAETFYFTTRLRPGQITIGDELLVQLAKEPIKTKLPVLDGNLNISGRFLVLVHGEKGIVFSRKIKKSAFQKELKAYLEAHNLIPDTCAVIVRTNAADAETEQIEQEARELKARYETMLEKAPYQKCFSRIWKEEHPFLSLIRDYPMDRDLEIVTDIRELYEEICEKIQGVQVIKEVSELVKKIKSSKTISPQEKYCSDGSAKRFHLTENVELTEDADRAVGHTGNSTDREFHTEPFSGLYLRYYEDPKLSLTALYSLNTIFDQALGTRVWLKSGGYLVLEPTEALTVIDVNTGKSIDRISKEQHLLRTNLEAAREIAVQLRLRNYCGIILIDFIDMEEESHTEQLLNCLKQELAKDRTKTSFVDMTRLNLAEVTRKRIRRPLHEAVKDL